VLNAALAAVVSLLLGVSPALGGNSWLSKARRVRPPAPEGFALQAAGDIGTTVFDVVISLYNSPAGDDDPTNDTGAEEQTEYEELVRFWADAVCEQSNQALKLGKVRFFRNGVQGSLADVVWNGSEWPRAAPSGFGVSGRSIIFGDVFPEGCGPGCDINFLDTAARREDGGYTLGHEFGHYVLGLYDEYVGSDPDETRIHFPQTGDTAVSPSIMNNQWRARAWGDFAWLNHSTSDNYEADTAQGRVYAESGWDVMIQPVGDDPKDGDRSSLAQRVRYTTLVGNEPGADDGWVVVGLPGTQGDCRSELEIIWMQDDIEMQLVIDRSGSMTGTPLANARQAAKTLVDEVDDGSTALGVVAFDTTPEQAQPIVAIPDPPGAVKSNIKAVIDTLTATGLTAMYDAAKLGLDNLQSYAAANATNAAQLVFLLSDGLDNRSSETQATVTAAYQTADVPLNTFAYGSFAPEGVLRSLAADTGGLFRATPTDLAEIQSALLASKAALTTSAGLVQDGLAVGSGQQGLLTFPVDGTLEELSLFANYRGLPGTVTLSVTGPTLPGGIPFACVPVSTEVSCSAVVDEATLVPGTWAVTVQNNSPSTVVVNVDVLATPRPVRTYDLVVSSLGGTEVTFPAPLIVTATLSQGLPITNAQVAAILTDPLGATSDLALNDEGLEGDAVAADGTYSAIVVPTEDGIYEIRVEASNPALTAEFTTGGFLPGHTASAAEDGTTPTPPPLPTIDEDLRRTASLQVLVSGVTGDDHPDTPPGTPLSPDNGDVDGRIEIPGDVDVFTVATTGLSSLTFRVTGLAHGMEPRLRILDEAGVELLSAVESDLVPDAEYLALSVAVDGNSMLSAEVSHASGETGLYQISAGARIVSDPALFVIDVKPDSEENVVNPRSRGVIPVAVMGSPIYDVSQIDAKSLSLGPGGAPAAHPRGGVLDHFDADGLLDYLNHFRTAKTGITNGDTNICLTGLVAGVPFAACDAIKTVP
jgi:uncharacterized protein YegL